MKYSNNINLYKPVILLISLLTVLLLNGCAMSSKSTKTVLTEAEKHKQVQQFTTQGDQALRVSDYKKSIYNYMEALRLDAQNVDILYKVGAIHRQIGDLDTAKKTFAQILRIEPAHSGALEELGLVLLHKRNYEEAKVYLLESIRFDHKRWRALNAMGIISDIDNNHADAITYFREALYIRSNNPMLLNNMGYSYYLYGNWASAEHNFKKAIALDSKHVKTLSNLGMLYVRQGHYDKALDTFTRHMKKPEAYLNMGYICQLEGNYSQAEVFYMSAIRLSSSYFEEAHKSLNYVRSTYLARAK